VLIGQQTPRLQLSPPSATNAAEDAISIYEACGQRLDPWQELCLRIGCGEREDSSWASFENGIICQRQNGKGEPISALCLASLFVWGNRVTVYSAHRGTTVRATFRKIKHLIETTPDLARRCKVINDSDDTIETLDGARLEFHTRTRSGGRGLTGDLVILDEALEVNAEQIASLVPIMLARPYAQLWYFSTVPLFADQHLCTVRARVLDGGERLGWAEWGNDKGVDLDDPGALAAGNPALGIRIYLERLKDLRGILGDEKYSAECMGIWPSMAGGTVLDPAVWKGLVEVTSRRAPGADVCMSLDVTPLRDHGSIGMHGLRADGLEHVQLTDYEAGTDWMVARAADHQRVLRPVLWVIDRKNGAFALVDDLAAVGIKVAADPQALKRGELLVLDMGEVADSTAQFIDVFRRRLLRHVGEDPRAPLNLAVGNAKPRPIGDAGQIAWGRKLSTVDIGPLVTVTQARYGSQAWLTRRAKAVPRSKVW
jgi:hypothetical protein